MKGKRRRGQFATWYGLDNVDKHGAGGSYRALNDSKLRFSIKLLYSLTFPVSDRYRTL
jgi:hypothetical protein